MPTFRNTCPRHCYGPCSMISHINGDKLTRVLGDPNQNFTQGHLCAKGYALIKYALDNNRLKYPLQQLTRGSGQWRRITWENAYEIIAEKIFDLNKSYGSNLSLGYYKGTGNAGYLHDAVVGMFMGFGPHTQPVGNICSDTGKIALRDVIGSLGNPDPEEMAEANLIVLWGANPTVTNVNQMRFIHEARQKGSSLIVIDPLFTKTGEKADLYIQIKPGTDAWLAYGIAKIILQKEWTNNAFIKTQTLQSVPFMKVIDNLSMDEISIKTGVSYSAIEELANLYGNKKPVATWIGFGLQKSLHANESIKAISVLPALTGNFLLPGGGLYFRNYHYKDFPRKLVSFDEKSSDIKAKSRHLPINNFARHALELNNPPLKLLWISCGNPLAQDYNMPLWHKLFNQLELIVTADLYLTSTAKQSDLVLPVASFFEEEDLHISFWHHWLSFNAKTLTPFYSTKSDLQIARELTKYLNNIQVGFSSFPDEKEPTDWIKEELTPKIQELYSIDNYENLQKASYKRKKNIPPSDWKYTFPLPNLEKGNDDKDRRDFPYLLFTPQALLTFNSQYKTLSWLNEQKETIFELPEQAAVLHSIRDGTLVEIYNEYGHIQGFAKINPFLPENIILTDQDEQEEINKLISGELINKEDFPFFNCRVKLRKVKDYF